MKPWNSHAGSSIADKGWLCPKCRNVVVKGGMATNASGATGRQRYMCRACRWHGTLPLGYKPPTDGIDQKRSKAIASQIKSERGVRRYAITAAQNATPINKAFFAALTAWVKANGAELLVVPYRYKNPTSIWTANAEHDDWWAEGLAPYLLDQRVNLNRHLALLADIKTQPTAVSPLTGYETISGARSAILGHPQIALTTVPTPQSSLPKLLVTTGAVTVPNYVDSKAGKKAEHHHSFGATVVELSGETFHIRQINAIHDGSFIDLDRKYSADGVTKAPRAKALVMGDTHQEFMDPEVEDATFGKGGIVSTLEPEYLVWHDLHDFYARNHHHRGEVFINFAKHHSGHDNVQEALKGTYAFVDRVTPPDATNIIVPSNHPDALARWVKETDPRSDPENAMFWAETFHAMCAGSKWTEAGAATIDPFAYWGKKWLKRADRTKFLARDETFLIAGIQIDLHGDKGANGAKASPNGLARLGAKTVTGHRHSPFIRMGAYGVGTNSRLRLGYNAGPSSWLHTDCVIYANGKRTLLHIINGQWRA